MLGVILPPWVHSGGTDKLLGRRLLASPELRAKMIEDISRAFLVVGITSLILQAWIDFVTSVKTEKIRMLLV